MDNLESRVTDLEIQISHQEKMLEELNSVIISQQNTLESLKTMNNFILQNLQSIGKTDSNSLSDELQEEPPHY
mgnify:CR=1 FL=1